MDSFQESSVQMDQAERVKRYGVECIGPSGDGCFFKAGTWRPGGEYIQKLILRNVSNTVKKFKYKLPSTRYFSLAYPEPIILSPGMFKEIDVIFRPVELEPYDDTLYIKMLDGIEGNGFHVPVRATIDKLILEAPEGLDLGYCATHQISTLTFKLVNTGEVDAPYKWEVPTPFIFTPSSGTIAAGQYHDIVVTIRPEDASVFVSQAICHVGTGVHAIIPNPIIMTKLSAIGKYAYISLSEKLVTFEEVVSGTKPDKQEIVLRNNGVVPAEFTLVRFDSDRDEVFDITPKSGVILPRSELTVTVRYSALAMGCYSLDRYVYRTPGNCSTLLVCKGTAMPPRLLLFKEAAISHGLPLDEATVAATTVTLPNGKQFSEASPEFSLNFRDVEVGRVESRIIFLQNNTARDVAYSIVADENGTFKMFPRQGVIPALSSTFAVKVLFSPPKPNNYYRRFFVLVGDALPLFYDCLGTGFIRAKGEVKEQRPAPIRHAHVQAFRNRSVVGLGGLSPDELDAMYESGESQAQYFALIGRTGTKAMSVTALQRPVTRTGESVRTSVAPAHEFFVSDTDARSREITLNKVSLDFGYASHHKPSDPQTVHITNRTNAKVVVQWSIPVVSGVTLPDRKVEDRQVISADTAIQELLLLQAFTVSPMTTEINPGKTASFEVTFVPKQSNRNFVCELEAHVFFKNQRTFRLVNDYSLTPPWCLTVGGVGHTFASGQLLAKAALTGGNIRNGKLVFPCCFEGESIYQTFMLRNTSNLPSTFRIELGWESEGGLGATTAPSNDVFSVKPAMGEVAAEDFVLICVRFSPSASRKYIQLLRCIVNGETGAKLMLEGAGAVPYVVLPQLLGDDKGLAESVWGLNLKASTYVPKGYQGNFYLNPTCVGLTSTRELTIKNGSRLPLKFRLTLHPSAEGVVSIHPMAGVLKGNEDIQLTVTFSPRVSSIEQFKLQMQVYPIGGRTMRVLDANQPGPVVQPEVLQTLTLDIVAPGEVSALVFEPSRLVADVRLVNTTEQKVIFLDNVSDADLKYQLLYKEEFVADSVNQNETRTESEVMPLVPSKAGFGEVQVEAGYDHCLYCATPNGVIPARSRLRVVFTYMPKKSGLFEFLIYAQVQALDKETRQPVMLSNDDAAAMRVSQTSGGGGGGGEFAFDSSFTLLPLMANITARAAFPKLLFEDIRTDADLQISDIDYLWKRFSFTQLNYDLSVPLTEEEVKFNDNSTPDLSKVPKYPFEFSPAVVGAPLQKLMIRVRNNGYLTSSFHMHLPNESTLDLEQWCDEDEPSEELNRLICIIEELKLFTIEPRAKVLLPGEVCTVTISYSHSSLKYLGCHNLPVLVKLDQGKQFYLDLTGQTLPAPQLMGGANRKLVASSDRSVAPSVTSNNNSNAGGVPHSVSATPSGHVRSGVPATPLSEMLLVLCTGMDKTVRLLPVPTGLSAALAPRQRTELINVSGVSINYEVDQVPLQLLNEENYHMTVIRVANPVGTIAPGQSVFLEWYFYPLEARSYEFPLNISYYVAAPVASYFPPGSGKSSPPKSSNVMRKNSSSSFTLKTSSFHTAAPGDRTGANTPAVAVPLVYQHLNYRVQLTGYDPRDAKPIRLESLFEGGLPPTDPILSLPSQSVTLTHDLIDFAVVPQYCSSRRVIMLQNPSESAYEFVVDESSCALSIEGLLSVAPVFGRIEPGGNQVLDFTFKASTQPILFEERIKLMVREIIKVGKDRRAGVKHLLDRIKTKKTTSTEHESVVSRPTFARSVQMETLYVPDEGRKVTFPTTMDTKGKLVQANARAHLNHELGIDPAAQDRANDFSVMDNSALSPSNPNRIMEFDVPPSRGGKPSATVGFDRTLDSRGSSNVLGSKTMPLPESGGDMTPLSLGARGRTGSDMSRNTSRGLSTGHTNRTGGSRLDGRDNTLLGTASILIVRLKGEVHGLETTRNIVERVDASTGQRKDIMSEFVVPKQLWFIPPVGKRIDDPEIVLAQQKQRVDLSTVHGRDAELRTMSEHVINLLVKDLLNSAATRDVMQVSLTGANPQSIKDPADRLHGTYGLHYHEIMPRVPLEDRLIVEAQRAGFISSTPSPNAGQARTANVDEIAKLPAQWRNAGDELLLVDRNTFSLTSSDLWVFLGKLAISEGSCPDLFKQIEKSTPKGQQDVNVAKFVLSLSRETAREVERRVCVLREDRLLAERSSRRQAAVETASEEEGGAVTDTEARSEEGEPAAHSEPVVEAEAPAPEVSLAAEASEPVASGDKDGQAVDPRVAPLKLSVDTVASLPAAEAPSHTAVAFRDQEFLGIASETIGDVVLNLLRDILRPPPVEEDRSVASLSL